MKEELEGLILKLTTDFEKTIPQKENERTEIIEAFKNYLYLAVQTIEESTSKFISKDLDSVKQSLKDKKIEPIIIGDGNKVINQYPNVGSKVLSYDKVFLVTNDKNYTLPNLVGWSRKDVITLLDLLNIEYTLEGTGYVTNQSLPANTTLTGEEVLTLILSDKYNLNSVTE